MVRYFSGDTMKKRRPRVFFYAMLIAILIFAGFIYLGREYPASVEAKAVWQATDVKVTSISQGIEVEPLTDNGTLGVLIYPGAQINPAAYLPLAREIALRLNQSVFIVKFPFNLAVLNSNAGKSVMNKYVHDDWILIGHSLGGAMGSSLAASDTRIKGMVMLGAYPSKNLSKSTLPTLSIQGSQDNVMTASEFVQKKKNFPSSTEFYIIEGANHSQFGSYGLQADDFGATISAEKQRSVIIDFIQDWLMNGFGG